jgi:hypothetical protein
MNKFKLAVTDCGEGLALVHSRFEDVEPDLHVGMHAALKLAPSRVRPTTEDIHEWVERILAHATKAPEAEIDGLAEALKCLLSLDERPAEQLIGDARAGTGRVRRAVRALRRLPRRT